MINEIMSSIGIVGGLTSVTVFLQYLRDRKSNAIRTYVQEQTQDEQIEAITIGNLEKKLLYLERVIQTLTDQNERLEARDASRLARIQELEDRLDAALTNMRQMKRELSQLREEGTITS